MADNATVHDTGPAQDPTRPGTGGHGRSRQRLITALTAGAILAAGAGTIAVASATTWHPGGTVQPVPQSCPQSRPQSGMQSRPQSAPQSCPATSPVHWMPGHHDGYRPPKW